LHDVFLVETMGAMLQAAILHLIASVVHLGRH